MSDFSKNMNSPEEGWNRIADKKILSDGQVWIICPFCHKKAIRIFYETKIHMMPYICRGSKCKGKFIINVE